MKKAYCIFMIVLVIICLGIILINTQKIEKSGLSLEYMNSDEITEDIKSPTNIHVVLAKYKGEIKPKTISKFSYNLAYNIIPKYVGLLNEGKIKVNDKFHYLINKNIILYQTGIDSYEEYNQFLNKIANLSGNLEIEYYNIPINSINASANELVAKLNIKYKDNDEITFDFNLGSNSDKKYTGIKIW